MKIVFLGTPEFAVPTLNSLLNSHHEVVAVVTQPQKESGRGKKLQSSAVGKVAKQHNLPLYEFENISRDGESVLKSLNPDILVTCAYGQILRENILTLAPHGVINVHGSILPKYRGASPIQWTVINGDKIAGITILKSEIGLDDGPVITKHEIEVAPFTTSEELFEILGNIAPQVLLKALSEIENGTATYTDQYHENATICKKLRKTMRNLDFSKNALTLANLINGINVWPVAEINANEQVYKVYKAKVLDPQKQQQFNLSAENYANGQVVLSSPKQGLVVKVENGFIELLELQAQGGKRLSAKDFLNGKKIEVGTVLK